jgi:hypothetical protein
MVCQRVTKTTRFAKRACTTPKAEGLRDTLQNGQRCIGVTAVEWLDSPMTVSTWHKSAATQATVLKEFIMIICGREGGLRCENEVSG